MFKKSPYVQKTGAYVPKMCGGSKLSGMVVHCGKEKTKERTKKNQYQGLETCMHLEPLTLSPSTAPPSLPVTGIVVC